MKFKLGDRVKNIGGGWQNGAVPAGEVGTIIEVIKGQNHPYKVRSYKTGATEVFNDEQLELTPKTLSTLVPGDILLDADGWHEREVVLAKDKYVITEDIYDNSRDHSVYKVSELTDWGWTIKGNDDIKELTLEEVAKLAGVDVSKLRIKD